MLLLLLLLLLLALDPNNEPRKDIQDADWSVADERSRARLGPW